MNLKMGEDVVGLDIQHTCTALWNNPAFMAMR